MFRGLQLEVLLVALGRVWLRGRGYTEASFAVAAALLIQRLSQRARCPCEPPARILDFGIRLPFPGQVMSQLSER